MGITADVLDTPRAPSVVADEEAEATYAFNMKQEEQRTTKAVPVIVNRDPADIRSILRLASSGIGHVVVELMLVAVILYQAFAGTPLVVVDRTMVGDRVVYMNGKQIIGGVSVSADNPGDEMKVSASKAFTKFLYQVDPDPDIRAANIESALRMMEPTAAKNLVKAWESKRSLQTQRNERWQTTWIPLLTTIDKDDPFKVHIVGRQEITRIISDTPRHENQQLVITLKLYKDTKRADYNQNTGFMVENILDYQEIPEPVARASEAAPTTQLAVQQ